MLQPRRARLHLTPNAVQLLLLGLAFVLLCCLTVATALLIPHPHDVSQIQDFQAVPHPLPPIAPNGNTSDPTAGGLVIIAFSTLLTFALFAFYLRLRATYLHFRRQHLHHALSQPKDDEAEIGAPPPFTPLVERFLILSPSKIHPPPRAASHSTTPAQSAIIAEAARERERVNGREASPRNRESIGSAVPAPEYGSQELEKDEVLLRGAPKAESVDA
ncbi:hypothetical protein BCR35DRAFT_334437 [Leucosporidium creatinivorum]|uniref:Uncharacterized protein n=1 Tax=Leucosporidium creatinivorum TaxID=106004 RepID=A0A1Y2E9U2_9BASI|nr:hypothetical protein BCR35DRAFT_334437 [Leucosporidium creatinivorum]